MSSSTPSLDQISSHYILQKTSRLYSPQNIAIITYCMLMPVHENLILTYGLQSDLSDSRQYQLGLPNHNLR